MKTQFQRLAGMRFGGTLGGGESPQAVVQAVLPGGFQRGNHLPVQPLGLQPAAFLGSELKR